MKTKPLRKEKHIFVWGDDRKHHQNQEYVYADYDITKRKDLEHDLITTWVHITLHSSFNLLYWKRGKVKYKGKLNDDAYCILGVQLPDRLGEVHYYLESDTGCEGYAQIEERLARYLVQYEKEGKAFFVLFVCANEQRAKDLARRAERIAPKEKRKLYLFTWLERLRENPTGQICLVPHEESFSTILPQVK